MDNINPKNILDHLDHKSDQEQQQELYEWLQSDPDNYDDYFDIKLLWAEKKVRQHDTKEEVDAAFSTFSKNVKKLETAKRGRNTRLILTGIAASLLIVSGLWVYLSAFAGDLTLTNPDHDRIAEFILDDGSTVVLNVDSAISFSKRFGKGKGSRNVTLERGEAFFDVVRNTSRPFIVNAGEISVRVLGTTFNVKAGDIVSTTLESGSVVIEDAQGNRLAELEPGQTAHYNTRQDTLEIENINASEYFSWKYAQIIYENINLDRLFEEIEKRYGVVIDNQTGIGSDKNYRFVISNGESLEDVLDALKYLAPIEYTMTNTGRVRVTPANPS